MSFTFFTDRLGGYSQGDFSSLNLALHVEDEAATVLRNRDVIEQSYGTTVYMNQVHGNNVEVISAPMDQILTCDGLVTNVAGITLAVLVADCIPLLLSSQNIVAAVHVGRRGLVNGVAAKTVNIMRELGADEITAKLGPSICGPCYEVDQVTYEEVISIHPSARSKTSAGSPALDLPTALVADLAKLSIESHVDSRCTREDDDLFSYRKSHRTGRQAGLIRL
ncbi:MAG: polyphenol oxidase family protein [Actinomycetes bacterium]